MENETELNKFLEENGVTEETKPEEVENDRLYDFSEKNLQYQQKKNLKIK